MHWESSLRAVQSRGCRYESKHCPGAALTALVNNKPAKCYVYLLLCWENQVLSADVLKLCFDSHFMSGLWTKTMDYGVVYD